MERAAEDPLLLKLTPEFSELETMLLSVILPPHPLYADVHVNFLGCMCNVTSDEAEHLGNYP